jgi:hypothetical protein
MIQANELRIGNWVLCNGLRTIVNDTLIISILKNDVQFTAEPIPLTPEILEKCGFDVVYKINNHYAINDPNGIKDSHKISVFPTINNQWHIAFSDTLNGYNDYTPTTKIQHLHQLQNLYFALTGEELTFKS